MLGVDVGFWETTMKPPEDNFGPATPDTPDLTVRLGNRLGTLTTPEGDAGMFFLNAQGVKKCVYAFVVWEI